MAYNYSENLFLEEFPKKIWDREKLEKIVNKINLTMKRMLTKAYSGNTM